MVSNIRIEERIKIKALHDKSHGVPSITKYFKIENYQKEVNREYMITNMLKN